MGQSYIMDFYQPTKHLREMSQKEIDEFFVEYNKVKFFHLNRLSESQNHRCAYCGVDTYVGHWDKGNKSERQKATFDHIIPRSEGGADTMDNMIMACIDCNSVRGSRSVDEFYDLICMTPQKKMVCPKKEAKRIAKREAKFAASDAKAFYYILLAQKYLPDLFAVAYSDAMKNDQPVRRQTATTNRAKTAMARVRSRKKRVDNCRVSV
jgi:hypothetical protein